MPQQQSLHPHYPHPNPTRPSCSLGNQARPAPDSLAPLSGSSSYSPPDIQPVPRYTQLRQTSPLSTAKEDYGDQIRASRNLSQQQQQRQPFQNTNGYSDIGPVTISLPIESEILLKSALDPNDPKTPTPVVESEHLRQLSNYNISSSHSKTRGYQSTDSTSATLAPQSELHPALHSGSDGFMPDFFTARFTEAMIV